jgi:hypothetical protein
MITQAQRRIPVQYETYSWKARNGGQAILRLGSTRPGYPDHICAVFDVPAMIAQFLPKPAFENLFRSFRTKELFIIHFTRP